MSTCGDGLLLAGTSAESRRMGRNVTTVPIRQAVLRDRMGLEELVRRLLSHYQQQDCDGLFLSAVTYEDIRLPIRQTVQSLGPRRRPRMVVVDGAQALDHAPLGLAANYCELLLTGCHEWLRAYHPLGLAICCRRSLVVLPSTTANTNGVELPISSCSSMDMTQIAIDTEDHFGINVPDDVAQHSRTVGDGVLQLLAQPAAAAP